MAKDKPVDAVFGFPGPRRAIDDRLYEGLDENFNPSFVSFTPKAQPSRVEQKENPFLIRKNSNNRFIRKEERTLESLRREWSETLKTEEEKITPLVADVFKVDKRVRAQFVHDLKTNMDSIEAFFIKEIAPVEVALTDAMERSRQTIAVITDSDVEHESLEVLRSMFREAVKLKSFDFLCERLSLPPHLRTVLIEKYFKHESKKP